VLNIVIFARYFLLMKKLFVLVFMHILFVAKAQINEIGVFAGGSNFIGDIGKTNYISPNELAYGIVYKWNRSPRHAYRFSYTQSRITGDDLNSKVPGRNKRGLHFQNNIKEFAVGMEFNFFDFNLHQMDTKITPYIFTGVSYTIYDGLFFVGKTAKFDSNHGAVGIPMTVGIKSNITPSLILAGEIGVRYTFADDLDGSNPTNENLKNQKFGNINSNDWIMFTGITLTYTFGEKPCYCSD
jgi:Domain of unknown function (DUF6089)